MTEEEKAFVYARMRAIAKKVEREVPGFGFIVLVFPFGEGKEDEPECNYISNARREDVLGVMRDFMARTAISGKFRE